MLSRSIIGQRVRVDYDEGDSFRSVYGVVRGISRRGHKIETDDGKIIYAAWWRIVRVDVDD